MAQNMFGNALNPQNVVPLDINTSTSYAATVVPPYTNVSSGSYLLNIQPLSDAYLQTTDRGNVTTNYFSFSTASQVLIGTPSTFLLQNKNDFNYFPLVSRYSPFGNTGTVYTVLWNGIIWVAGGKGSSVAGSPTVNCTLASSTDGITWVPRDIGQIFTVQVNSLAWNGFLWVAVGSSGATSGGNIVATSPDGISWTGRGSFLINAYTGQTMARVASSPFSSLTLIGQNQNQAFYYGTTDGLNLTRYPYSATNYFWYAAYNGTLWVSAPGSNISNTIYTSPDGINWTSRGVNGTIQVLGVAFSPILGIWAICGTGGTVSAFIQYSYDTITWTNAAPATASTAYDIQWSSAPGQNIFVCVGAGPNVWTATAVGIFTVNATPPSGMTNLYSVAYCQSLGYWVTVGTGGSFSAAYSSTGLSGSWNGVVGSLALMTTPAQIAWSQSLGIMVVVGTGVNSIMTSTTGTSFTAAYGGAGQTYLTFSSAATGVAFNSTINQFIATGTGVNTFLSSPDGINWTPFGTTGVDNVGWAVGWSPLLNQFVMIGQGNHTIATSVNGINWVGRTATTVFGSSGNSYTILWIPGLNIWVAGGSGTSLLATSTNGIQWVIRTTPLTSACYSLAWNGSLLVAGGGSGTFLIATSPDCVNFTGRTQALISSAVYGITWSQTLGLFVAVGTGTNSIMTSPNGVTWSLPTGGAGASLLLVPTAYVVVWNPVQNQFIIGGNSTSSTTNTLLTSVDGANWLGMTSLHAILYTVNCVAWNGSIWVAGGISATANTVVASSPDGLVWTAASITNMTQIYGIAWSGISPVGSAQPVFPLATGGVGSSTFNWLVVGAGSASTLIAYSTTGTSWTGVTQSIITGTCFGVVWYPYGACWVVVGTTTNTLMYSQVANGSSGWTAGANNQITTSGRAVTYGYVGGAGLLVAVGQGATYNYVTSVNGVTWTGYLTSSTFPTGQSSFQWTIGNGIAWSPNTFTFVVTGSGNVTLAYSLTPSAGWFPCNNALATSTTTTFSVFGGGGTGQGNAVTWNGSMFIAVGQGVIATASVAAVLPYINQPANISGTVVPYAIEATSIDGINWRVAPYANSQFQYLGVGSRPPIMVCGGQGTSQVGFSVDGGITWVPRSTGSGATAFSTACYCVAFNGLIWLAGGGTGTANTLQYSKDGIVWSAITGGSYPGQGGAGAVFGLAWANSLGLWCAVGYTTTTIATSGDGLNWTARGGNVLFNNSANAVAWNGTVFVVLGNGTNTTIAISRDGLSWSYVAANATFPAPSSQTPATAALAWNGNVWIAVTNNGASNTIYWSSNSFTWNSIALTSPVSFGTTAGANGSRAVAWNGSLFVVGGLYPNYATSPDGFTWTVRTTLPTYTGNSFTQINTIAWNPVSSLWVMGVTDAGSALIMTLTSPDAINWTYRMNNAFLTGTPIRAIAWSPTLNLWVICGQASGSTPSLGSCIDGVQITPRIFNATASNFNAVAWSGTFFLAGGVGMYSSPDGIIWTSQGLPSTFTVIYGIAWGATANIWVVVGFASSTGVYATGSIVSAITLNAAGSTAFSAAQPARAVATNAAAPGYSGTVSNPGSLFLVVGVTGGATNASYYNGSTWSNTAIASFTGGGYGVTFVPWLSTGTWVAVGNGTGAQIVYGTNPASLGNASTGNAIFTTGYAVAANNCIIVAVGTGTYQIAYSYNGLNWTGVSQTGIFTNGYAVAWNGTEFIAGGDNNVQATSPDGVNWTVRKVFSTATYAIGFQQREKLLTINNAQWTGRTSQQNFRVIG